LEEQKRELAGLLTRLPQPLLVVIDDIDRLTTEEILQVFQLVKANADFPRLIYLLLFEREVVAKALNQISGDKGTEFLEKIIQVLRDALTRSTGLALPVHVVSLEERVGDREARGHEFLVEEASLPELKSVCADNYALHQKAGRFVSIRDSSASFLDGANGRQLKKFAHGLPATPKIPMALSGSLVFFLGKCILGDRNTKSVITFNSQSLSASPTLQS